MVAEIIGKLSPDQRKYCEIQCALIYNAKHDSTIDYNNMCGRLSGFLDALCMVGVITKNEKGLLYMHYFTGKMFY